MIASRLAIAAVASVLFASTLAAAEAPAQSLERRFTATGSTDNTNTCSDLELIWFRSGYEGQGPSLGLMGDPLYNEIVKQASALSPPPSVSGYNVIFDTNLWEEVFTNIAAGLDATRWINRRSKECPNQRYFVAGYSKGTLPLHQVYPANPGRERVVASLAVGDFMARNPYVPPLIFNSSWPSNGPYSIKSLCNVGDEICYPGGKDHNIHLHPAYLAQLPAAVTWMLDLYQRNLKAPFKYQWTWANH